MNLLEKFFNLFKPQSQEAKLKKLLSKFKAKVDKLEKDYNTLEQDKSYDDFIEFVYQFANVVEAIRELDKFHGTKYQDGTTFYLDEIIPSYRKVENIISKVKKVYGVERDVIIDYYDAIYDFKLIAENWLHIESRISKFNLV